MTNRNTRPQFSIRTLLWLTLVVAAFFGGLFLGGIQGTARIEADRDALLHLADQYEQVDPNWRERRSASHPDDGKDSWD